MTGPELANPEPEPQTISEYTYVFARRVFEAEPGTESLTHAWRSMIMGVLAQHLYDSDTGKARPYGARPAALNETLVDAVVTGYAAAENPEKVPESSLGRIIVSVRSFSRQDWEDYRRFLWKGIVYPKGSGAPLDMLAGLYKGTIHYDDLMERFEESLGSTDFEQTDN